MSKAQKSKLPANIKNLNTKKKQSFFKKLFCPCLCSKNSNSQKKPNQKNSYLREEFYEQQSQKQQNLHEETQSNLPIDKNKNSQFDILKNLQANLQVNKINSIEQQNRNGGVRVKFNVKRNNMLQGYLKEVQVREQGRYEKSKQYDERNCQKVGEREWASNVKWQIQNLKKGDNKRVLQKLNYNKLNIKREQLISIEKHLQNMDHFPDYQFLANWQNSFENHYPVNSFPQNKLLPIGNKQHKLLTKITSVKTFPHPSSIQRYKQSIKNKNNKIKSSSQQTKFSYSIDKYWDKRYFLFQKFDQGIKLDQQSWYSVTPQAVADYISSKINVKQTILDAFCGAGGDTIKLATCCKRVISNDIDPIKIKCLVNNAKIYDIQNIQISCQNFFQLNTFVEAVYLAPPWGGPDYYKIQSFQPQDFQPKLSLIFQKAFSLSNNIFFLLPANTNIQSLASIISEQIKLKKTFKPQSCSLKLQKIYFNQRLKFIAGFYGNNQIQSDIKLAQQLSYIYDLLKQGEDGIFKQKKLIRKIREQYGMVNLLNYIFECQLVFYNQSNQSNQSSQQIQQISMIQKFKKYLLQHKLISQADLKKIKQFQQMQYQYEIKNRDRKNKKQKNKKIQKIKQKLNKQRQLSENLNEKSKETQNNINMNEDLDNQQQEIISEEQIQEKQFDIPIQNIVRQANKIKKGISSYRNQLKQTIQSNLSSEIPIQQNSYNPPRQSLNTVSIVSQFEQDELQNILNQRNRTKSDVSIMDDIHHIRRINTLEISMVQSQDKSFQLNQQEKQYEKNNKLGFGLKRQNDKGLNEKAFASRYSSPLQNSVGQSIWMKKNKIGHNWQKGKVTYIKEDQSQEMS